MIILILTYHPNLGGSRVAQSALLQEERYNTANYGENIGESGIQQSASVHQTDGLSKQQRRTRLMVEMIAMVNCW